MKLNKQQPVCRYCSKSAELVTGKTLYPTRKDLFTLNFWVCYRCDARVGTHPGTITPLGHLADAELRRWRAKAHLFFDPVWKNSRWSRGRAYTWLAKELGITKHRCHIANFDAARCEKVVEVSMRKRGML